MNYTEEEFFGNKQNESQEQNESQMQNERQENKVDISGTIFLTFIKTFGVLVCAVFYFLAVSLFLMPQTSIKIYEFFGAKGAVITCYERLYERSGSLADLYNLVQKSIEAKNYEKTNKYIEELQAKSDYDEFCIEVNQAIIDASENKYIAYRGDLDGYLVSQNILALYTANKKEQAEQIAISDLINNENIYSFGVSTFVDSLLGDNDYTEEERNQKLIEFYEQTYDNSIVVKSISDYINEKRINADISNTSGDKADKILRVYTCLKIESVKLKYYQAKGDEINANVARLQIEELQELYADLIS